MTIAEDKVTTVVQRTLAKCRAKSETFWQESQKILDRIAKSNDRKKSLAWFGYLLCGMEVAHALSHAQVEYLLEELATSRDVTYGFEVSAIANAKEDEPNDEDDDSYDEIDIPSSTQADIVLEFVCSGCGYNIATLSRKVLYPLGVSPTALYFEPIPRISAMGIALGYGVSHTVWNVELAELAIWLNPVGIDETLDEENAALMFSLLIEAGWSYSTPEDANWYKKLRRHRRAKRKKKHEG